MGASRSEAADDRAVVVEKGEFRFAAQGSRIDAIEVDPAGFKPLEDAALFPALEAEATSERGAFLVLHVDRLEACLARAMNLTELAA